MSTLNQLSGQTILCLSTQAWFAHWTPVQQVMQRLAPENRIIHVEPFHPPLAWLKKSNSVLKRELRRERQPVLRQVADNVFTYRPRYPYLPFNMRSRVVEKLNAPMYKAELISLLKKFDAREFWLWAFFGQNASVLNLNYKHFIYDCADDYPPYFPRQSEKKFVNKIDAEFCRRADIVFVGSEPLRIKKIDFNSRTFVVNHAADVAHFMKAAADETVVPKDLEAIPHPRLGFVGMMDAIRFDVELIRKLAENPLYQIVIVGDFVGELKVTLPAQPNIHLLGMKAISELPSYLKGLDICLMPYQVNETTRYIYPLKLHEYMATGKPVVSTMIPAVESFREVIYVADSAGDFVESVARALKESDVDLKLKRREIAQRHSWEHHVKRKIELINSQLNDEPSRAYATLDNNHLATNLAA